MPERIPNNALTILEFLDKAIAARYPENELHPLHWQSLYSDGVTGRKRFSSVWLYEAHYETLSVSESLSKNSLTAYLYNRKTQQFMELDSAFWESNYFITFVRNEIAAWSGQPSASCKDTVIFFTEHGLNHYKGLKAKYKNAQALRAAQQVFYGCGTKQYTKRMLNESLPYREYLGRRVLDRAWSVAPPNAKKPGRPRKHKS